MKSLRYFKYMLVGKTSSSNQRVPGMPHPFSLLISGMRLGLCRCTTVSKKDSARARGIFVHHQDGLSISWNIKTALLKGSGEVEQIDTLQNQGSIDIVFQILRSSVFFQHLT
jgi:hypothetical protein